MKKRIHIFHLLIIFSLTLGACAPGPTPEVQPAEFDEQSAYRYAQTQISFGFRYPGSEGHTAMIDWLQSELEANHWQVTFYEYPYQDLIITNVIAHRDGAAPHILLGAHYDTRLHADQDQENPSAPVMGANDGASGVAVLLELSRVIPQNLPNELTLAFFDLEDQGQIGQYSWIAGSTALTDDPNFSLPDQAIIMDMIGDQDLNIYMDHNSDTALSAQLWQAAAELGYSDIFIPEPKYSMLDDHTPFLNHEIPAIDIIDFDYAYWHTTQDTLDKISPKSLGIVGQTLLYWLSKPIDSEDENKSYE